MKFSRVCAVAAAAALVSLPATVAGAVEAPQSTEKPQSASTADAGQSTPTVTAPLEETTDPQQSGSSQDKEQSKDQGQEGVVSQSETLHYFHYHGQREYAVVGGDDHIQLSLTAAEDAKQAYVLDYFLELPQGYAGTFSGEMVCVLPVSSKDACDRITFVKENESQTLFRAHWKPMAGDKIVLRGYGRIAETVPPKEGLDIALTAVLSSADQLLTAPMRVEVKLFANDEAAKAAQDEKPENTSVKDPQTKDPKTAGMKNTAQNSKAAKLAKTGWDTGILASVVMLGAATGSLLLRRR